MTGLLTIIRKELKCFGGDKGQFLIYALMSALWSLALFLDGAAGGAMGVRFWSVFFAVIVAAGFSGTVFISERVTGTLEVLLTSGVSRGAVFFGKMVFATGMSTAVGALCAFFALLWGFAFGAGAPIWLGASDAALYVSTVYLNAAVSACLSVRLGNPRFLHFINLFITAALLAAYSAVWALYAVPWPALAAGFLLTGALFTFLARREFAGERVTRPVIF
jgi:ABC-type transport system involved in multi-copper enzyme maturation permease subunit